MCQTTLSNQKDDRNLNFYQQSIKGDKERYSTPALGGKMRGGGMLQMDDVTNIFSFNCSIFKKLNLIDYSFDVKAV